jgi:hypothetical protein
MQKSILISILILPLFLLNGCASNIAETPSTIPSPSDSAPTASAPPTSSPIAGDEELTPKLEGGETDIPQRSLKDLNALNRDIQTTMAEINKNGFVQMETLTGTSMGTKIGYIYDPTRVTGEKGIIYFGTEEAGVAPMPENMLKSLSMNGGLFRIDSLLFDAVVIKDMLYYNGSGSGNIPSAEAYEKLTSQDGYKFISSTTGIALTITVNKGIISRIEETLEDGSSIIYAFEYDTSNYEEYFEKAYPKD